MRFFFKSITPPLIWDKLKYIREYKYFLRYKSLVSKNIELKNLYKGKRCFILGSGPSIKKEDLKPLKNEIVFALNNFYVHQDFAEIISGTVPKYYMTAPIHPPQTETEWKVWFEDMEKHIPKSVNMLFGLSRYDGNIKYIFDKYGIFRKHKISWYFAGKNYSCERFDSTAMDATKVIYNGEAVSIYSLILAIYMGFDEIYLLGMDHDYFLYENESQMRMYSSAKHQQNEFARTYGDTFYVKEFLRQYNIFSKYKVFDDKSSSKIFNASNGGILKVFPRVKFKDLFDK
ncbi:hypothetical protein QIW49_05435 [Francisellaceae bacterium CB300]